MGPVTAMAAPSMIPTESEAGSSGRAAKAVRRPVARTLTLASSQMVRRVSRGSMEVSGTQSYSRNNRGGSHLYYTSAGLPPHLELSADRCIKKVHVSTKHNPGDREAAGARAGQFAL